MSESRFRFGFGDKVTFNDTSGTYLKCPAIVVGRSWYPSIPEPQYSIVIRDRYISPNHPDHIDSFSPSRSVSESELTEGWAD